MSLCLHITNTYLVQILHVELDFYFIFFILLSDAQRELRQKTEQLKRAILLLSGRENDKNLSKLALQHLHLGSCFMFALTQCALDLDFSAREILRLQFEVDRLATLVSNFEETLEPTITGE